MADRRDPPASLGIVSVFSPSERNRQWREIQRDFVARTTDVSFDYHVILNGVDSSFFDSNEVIIRNRENIGHGEALMQAVAYLRERSYDACLLIDSDCFPVTEGWFGILTAQMRTFGRTFAAPVRAENLDLFPHPSAVFLLPRALRDKRIDFRRGAVCPNLLGVDVRDTGAALYEMRADLLPLIRTNVLNLHPVAAGLYSHLFYHHGAGSRGFEFRVLSRFDYHRHWWPPRPEAEIADELFRDLVADPTAFVARLAGTASGRTSSRRSS